MVPSPPSTRRSSPSPPTSVSMTFSTPSAHSSSNTPVPCPPETCKSHSLISLRFHLLICPRSIQLAGAVSLVQCPGAPRIPFFFGRAQPIAASPPGLVPDPFDSVESIMTRFGEVGFLTAEEVVAVVGGSHSVAGADDIVPNQQGVPFDQTPSVFDSQSPLSFSWNTDAHMFCSPNLRRCPAPRNPFHWVCTSCFISRFCFQYIIITAKEASRERSRLQLPARYACSQTTL